MLRGRPLLADVLAAAAVVGQGVTPTVSLITAASHRVTVAPNDCGIKSAVVFVSSCCGCCPEASGLYTMVVPMAVTRSYEHDSHHHSSDEAEYILYFFAFLA
jgi:hypothetical protein